MSLPKGSRERFRPGPGADQRSTHGPWPLSGPLPRTQDDVADVLGESRAVHAGLGAYPDIVDGAGLEDQGTHICLNEFGHIPDSLIEILGEIGLTNRMLVRQGVKRLQVIG